MKKIFKISLICLWVGWIPYIILAGIHVEDPLSLKGITVGIATMLILFSILSSLWIVTDIKFWSTIDELEEAKTALWEARMEHQKAKNELIRKIEKLNL